MASTKRNVRVFRYDPAEGGEGHFDSFTLEIPDETAMTMLEVLLRIQMEQDASIAFRFALLSSMPRPPRRTPGRVERGSDRR